MPNTNRSNSSSALSPSSASPQPTWAPPKAPLPPHRLAKLANALGVATPVPATHSHAPTHSPTPLNGMLTPTSLAPSEALRRSPTPSVASSNMPPAPSTSRYLLHVIPPLHLPHDTDDLEGTPVPPTASGYHTQFRRGVLVPVYSTLQSQLSAIAREYALPSTVGMVLYLITNMNAGNEEEPGPRISDDVWKHIWTRVLRAEKDELLTPGPRPLGLGLGYGIAGRSSPALLQDVAQGSLHSQSLRALISPRLPEGASTSFTPSPSTPSHSVYSSQSDMDTPESTTSIDGPSAANSLPLPGLESPALVPVLAKVEFDIDKKRAGWYETWVRSRKMNHAKRAESRLGGRSGSRSATGEEEEGEARKAPIDLTLVDKVNKHKGPSFLLTTETSSEPEELVEQQEDGYELLSDQDELEDEDLNARLEGVATDGDPLEDVFGKDEEMWADIRSSAEQRQPNPAVVNLALDASAVYSLPDNLEEDDDDSLPVPDDEADVSELLDRMPKPPLTVSIPEGAEIMLAKRQSSPTTAGTVKRHIPPPLHLLPQAQGELGIPEQASPMPSSAGSAQLAYLATPSSDGTVQESEPEIDLDAARQSLFPEDDDEDDDDDDSLDEDLLKKVNIRSPEDEKRDGAFFNDLNLGLDPSTTEDADFDDSDPYDRRKSQYIMAAQLDQIEKTLAQLSPRRLASEDLKPEDIPIHRRAQSTVSMRSPSLSGRLSLSPRKATLSPPPKSAGVLGGASWPAIPYTTINGKEDGVDRPPSPPKFAFNGITTEPPRQFRPQSHVSEEPSDETAARQRALNEEHGLYPPLTVPNMFGNGIDSDSPIIPLSPDPFGRYPSEAEATRLVEERNSQIFSDDGSSTVVSNVPDRNSSLTIPAAMVNDSRPPSQAPSSRFSMDSMTSEEVTKVATANNVNGGGSGSGSGKGSSSLMSVKSIRKLWRRSDSKRQSVSSIAQPESGRTSPNPAAPPPVPNNLPAGRSRAKSVSKGPLPPDPAAHSLQIPPIPPRGAMQVLQFDQQSPYPIHPVRPSISSSSPTPPSRPSSQQTHRSPSITPQVPMSAPSPGSEKSSARKSILKSWKSGNLSTSSSKGSISSTGSRSSSEQQPETIKRRRPSMIDLAAGAMRSSLSLNSASTINGEIPPSPALPEQYTVHGRSPSRQSQNTLSGRPSISSNNSTSSPPYSRSPLLAASSPPRNGLLSKQSRPSVDSHESRPSFDSSQFEMVSPPRASLTYPYNGLDHS